MIRASIGDAAYWRKWTEFSKETIARNLDQIQRPPGNPVYRPQYVWDLAEDYRRLLFRQYSAGAAVTELSQYFIGILDAWELSNALADRVCAENDLATCRDWTFELSNLNHYNWCFWVAGLGILLEVPDDEWKRLVLLVGGEGQDRLLDLVLKSRQRDREVGVNVLHPRPYQRLLDAIDASTEQQAQLLFQFLVHWYPELARKGKDEVWWYGYGHPSRRPLETGSYFGNWCIEAAAAAKAFNLDDSLCWGHADYPGDLVRPDGPSTHATRPESKPKWLAQLLSTFHRRH